MQTSRIIHITDLHLSDLSEIKKIDLRGKRILGYASWRFRRKNLYQSYQLESLLDAVKKEKADKILITGDLVHIGLENEYEEARNWLLKLGLADQVRIIPGNHDTYQEESWNLAREYFGNYLLCDLEQTSSQSQDYFPKTETHKDISLTAASTATVAPWWGAIGRLGKAQLERIKQSLTLNQQMFRVFLLHHPPLPKMCSGRTALSDAKELKKILKRTQPEMILHGHLHRNIVTKKKYGTIYCTASASSTSSDHPASYRIFDIKKSNEFWSVTMELKSLSKCNVETINKERIKTPITQFV